MREFELTEDHITLLANSVFMHDDSYSYGAVKIDPKRPYGNSGYRIYFDIGEMLGIEPEGKTDQHGGTEFTKEQTISMDRIHIELETAIEIIHTNKSFACGTYFYSIDAGRWIASDDMPDYVDIKSDNDETPKLTKYKLLSETSSSAITNAVNEALLDGWSLYGSPTTLYCGNSSDHAQAMIK